MINTNIPSTKMTNVNSLMNLNWDRDLTRWFETAAIDDKEKKQQAAKKIIAIINKIERHPQIKSHLLDLSDLGLPDLPPKKVFEALNGLSYLHLDGNHFSTTELSKIGAIHTLKMMNIGHNHELTDIPAEVINKMPHLNKIEASHCGFSHFPSALLGNIHLGRLDLSYNAIQELPTDIGFRMMGLGELNLAHNQLHKLPDSVKSWERLVSIDLSNNPLDVSADASLFPRSKSVQVIS